MMLLFDIHGEMMLNHGITNADPHAGNILIMDDGRLGSYAAVNTSMVNIHIVTRTHVVSSIFGEIYALTIFSLWRAGLLDYGSVLELSMEQRISYARYIIAMSEPVCICGLLLFRPRWHLHDSRRVAYCSGSLRFQSQIPPKLVCLAMCDLFQCQNFDEDEVVNAFRHVGFRTKGEDMLEAWDTRGEREPGNVPPLCSGVWCRNLGTQHMLLFLYVGCVVLDCHSQKTCHRSSNVGFDLALASQTSHMRNRWKYVPTPRQNLCFCMKCRSMTRLSQETVLMYPRLQSN